MSLEAVQAGQMGQRRDLTRSCDHKLAHAEPISELA